MRRPFSIFVLLLFCAPFAEANALWPIENTGPSKSNLDSVSVTPTLGAFGIGLNQAGGTTNVPSSLVLISLTCQLSHPKWNLTGGGEVMHGQTAFFEREATAGFNRRHGQGKSASRWFGRWTWTPMPSATVTLGKDTLHDGWGRRSLFRGRHAAPVAFAQVKLNSGGRLRYRQRIEALQGAFQMDCRPNAHGHAETWLPPVGRLRTNIERWVVSHRLELDFGKRMTGALWGAVVWNAEQRNFEPHYLLPLTSLRPTEYAQGSSDNALVGAEGRIRLGSNVDRPRMVYGQFLLDELLVSELLGGTEWWGNKFGCLGGIQWGTRWGGWRMELSAARPWTYSHFTSSSAYIHGRTPLAHPLGANFAELSFEASWKADPWMVHLRCTGSVRGDRANEDEPSGSLPHVGDIERTEETYAWLNGIHRKRFAIALDVARHVTIGKMTGMQAFAQALYGSETSNLIAPVAGEEWWVGFGIRSTGPFLGSDW